MGRQRHRIETLNSRETQSLVDRLGLDCCFGGTFTGPFTGHKFCRKSSGVVFVFEYDTSEQLKTLKQAASALEAARQ